MGIDRPKKPESFEQIFENLRNRAISEMESRASNVNDNFKGMVLIAQEKLTDIPFTKDDLDNLDVSYEEAYDLIFDLVHEGLLEFFTSKAGLSGMNTARTISEGYLTTLGMRLETAQEIVRTIERKLTQ